MRRRLVHSLVALGLIGAAATIYWYAQAGFYAGALRAHPLLSTVFYHGEEYRITDGHAYRGGERVRGFAQLGPLSLAYAVAAAERAPLYAIPGTDLDVLDREIYELARVQHKQADSLHTGEATHLARTALYPIEFLRTLAVAERERRAFLKSRTDTDLASYLDALAAVPPAQRRDASAFADAYRSVVSADSKFAGLGGSLHATDVERALDASIAASSANASGIENFERCASGIAFACGQESIALPYPATVADTHSASAQRQAERVAALWRPFVRQRGMLTVALASSTCAALAPAPYLFQTPDPSIATAYPEAPVRFLGDVYFATSTGATRQWSSMTGGMYTTSVVVWNPMVFYHCSDKGYDLGRAQAVASTYRFANAHPDIEPQLRARLLDTVTLHEDDAIAYVRGVFDASRAFPEERAKELGELVGIALMYKTSSGGLERAINEVRSLNELNVNLAQQGYGALDQSIMSLITTHSAFATLLQFYNPTVVPTMPPLYDRSSTALDVFLGKMERYSLSPQYHQALSDYVRKFRAFETLGL